MVHCGHFQRKTKSLLLITKPPTVKPTIRLLIYAMYIQFTFSNVIADYFFLPPEDYQHDSCVLPFQFATLNSLFMLVYTNKLCRSTPTRTRNPKIQTVAQRWIWRLTLCIQQGGFLITLKLSRLRQKNLYSKQLKPTIMVDHQQHVHHDFFTRLIS